MSGMTSRQRKTMRTAQRGAATLIVVMVLFFVMSLVAAYSSRNIIFDQKTSSNLQSANVVQESADAGLEWVMSMLNSGNITDSCTANLDPGAPTPTFRNRYLSTASNGSLSGSTSYPAGTTTPVATCGFDGATQQWTCSCPSDGTAAGVPGSSPAFSVRFVVPSAARPGVIRVEVNACQEANSACLNFAASEPSFCRGTACALVALQGGLKSPPIAAVMARGSVSVTNLLAVNPKESSAPVKSYGHTIISGGAVSLTSDDDQLRGPGGTRGTSTRVQDDVGLSATAFTADRMFAAYFGVWPGTFRLQPGLAVVDCSSTCNSLSVRQAAAINPGRALWLSGNVSLDGGGDIGTAISPVLLVVDGNLSFSSATTVYGFVYVKSANWDTTSAAPGQVVGGLAAQGTITGPGAITVTHDVDVLNLLRTRTGSMVRVPGSWVDFQ